MKLRFQKQAIGYRRVLQGAPEFRGLLKATVGATAYRDLFLVATVCYKLDDDLPVTNTNKATLSKISLQTFTPALNKKRHKRHCQQEKYHNSHCILKNVQLTLNHAVTMSLSLCKIMFLKL